MCQPGFCNWIYDIFVGFSRSIHNKFRRMFYKKQNLQIEKELRIQPAFFYVCVDEQ